MSFGTIIDYLLFLLTNHLGSVIVSVLFASSVVDRGSESWSD